MVWRRNLDLGFHHVGTTSRRLCAVVAHDHSVRLLIINVYMPNGNNCALSEIPSVTNCHDDYNIIGGSRCRFC